MYVPPSGSNDGGRGGSHAAPPARHSTGNDSADRPEETRSDDGYVLATAIAERHVALSEAGDPAPRTLLIGMGNPILCDDAVGIRLARDLRRRLGCRADLDIIEECCVGGLNLLDLVTGYDRLIVLDSIRTSGGAPGTWYRFDATALRETMNLTNVHDTNFATALELGRRMGSRVPADDENHIFAVEILDNMTFSEDLTPELEAAYPELADEIFGEVERLLG